MKKILALLLALAMLLALTACSSGTGGAADTAESAEPVSESPAETGAGAETDGLIEVNYRADSLALPEGLASASLIALRPNGDTLYAAGTDDDGTVRLFATGLGSDNWEELPIGEVTGDYVYATGLAATDNRVFLIISSYSEAGEETTLKIFDCAAKTELEGAALELPEDMWFNGYFGAGDKLIAYSSAGICAFSEDGSLYKRIDGDFTFTARVGELIIAGGPEDESGSAPLYEIDLDAGTAKELFKTEGSYTLSYTSTGMALLANDASVYSLDLESGSAEYLFNWYDTGADVMSLPGQFCCDGYGYIYLLDSYFASALSRISRYEGAPRTEITVGYVEGTSGTYLTKALSKFNATNTEYVARVERYKQDETDKLLVELSAGKGPDALYLDIYSGESIDPLASLDVDEGLCVDLMPYLESDAELAAGFIQPVLESMTDDGHLYKLIPCFNVNTVVAPEALAAELTDWTPEEMTELAQNLPEGYTLFDSYSQEDFLNTICMLSSIRFMDKESGTCSFDTGEFAAWLELAKNMKYLEDESVEGSALREGVFTTSTAGYFRRSYGADYEIIGYPGADGSYSFFSPCVKGFAIMQSSEHKDGAWEFIKTLLTAEVQEVICSFGFPVMESSFDELIDSCLEFAAKSDSYDFTEEDAQALKALVLSAQGMAEGSAATDIITEEAQKYFAGQKTLEDAVAMIQSRAGIYLAEQG